MSHSSKIDVCCFHWGNDKISWLVAGKCFPIEIVSNKISAKLFAKNSTSSDDPRVARIKICLVHGHSLIK